MMGTIHLKTMSWILLDLYQLHSIMMTISPSSAEIMIIIVIVSLSFFLSIQFNQLNLSGAFKTIFNFFKLPHSYGNTEL